MSRNTPSNSKQKWREGFQKSKMQKSIDSSRKSSLLEEETSDKELQEYLESLKRKSGIKRLWSGDKFDKTVREDEDKTPDISISSDDDDLDTQDLHSVEEKAEDSDDDFRPNLVMFPDSPKEQQSDNSASPELFQGIQLADFNLSDDDNEDKQTLNNDTPSKSLSISEPKDVKNIMNNLNLTMDVETEDEVAEEIDDEIDEVIQSDIDEMHDGNRADDVDSIVHSSPEAVYTPRESTPSGRRSKNRPRSQSKSLEHSYTMDFSTADEVSVIEEKTESSVSHSKSSSRSNSRSERSRSERSRSERSRSERSRSDRSRSERSRSKRSKSERSRSKCSSRSGDSSQSSTSISESYQKPSHKSDTRKDKNSRNKNSHLCDASVQTGLDFEMPPPGLAVGMATVNQRLGMQYVDPSPIATHVVSPEALEAVTAYNPAVAALTNMLKQQIRLVEQFVDANTRMYQAYTSNLNTGYRYTTLEDTLEFIRANRPKTISMKDALKQVKEEDS